MSQRPRPTSTWCVLFFLAACLAGGAAGDTVDNTRDIAESYFDLYRHLDYEGLKAFYTQYSILANPTYKEAHPGAEPLHLIGSDAILAFLKDLKAADVTFSIEPDNRFMIGNIAVFEGEFKRTFVAKDLTKHYADGAFVIVLTFDQGKVTRHAEYFDYRYRANPSPVLPAMVGASYVFWTLALGIMIFQGYRQKTYGMPLAGLTAMFALCFIVGFVGPWVYPRLFLPKTQMILIWLWRIWAILLAVIFVQYLIHGRKFQLLAVGRRQFYFVAWSLLAVALVTEWTFIIFYQDYYVNESSPIVVLVVALAYFVMLYSRADLRGLSVGAAWLMALGTLLLYVAVVLGDLSAAYPFKHNGYGFIYWVFLFTVVLQFAYAWLIFRRRKELDPDWNPEETLRWIIGRHPERAD